MKKMQALLGLKHLYRLKALGYRYAQPPKEFEIDVGNFLPNTFNELETIVSQCHMCDLAKTRTKTVFGEGDPNAQIMFIGEAPGEMEDKTGRPFVGRAGQLLTQMIDDAVGIGRNEVYIANTVKCRPPSNAMPTHAQTASCKQFLLKQIEIVSPKVIVALGKTALETLLSTEISITKVRGKVFKVGQTQLVATFHPSFLLRNPSEIESVKNDFKLAASIAAKPD